MSPSATTFRRAADACREHRYLHRHGLKRSVGEVPGVRLQHHQVDLLEEPRRLRDVAHEVYLAVDAKPARLVLERGPLRAVAGQNSREPQTLCGQVSESLREVRVALLTAQAADGHNDRARHASPCDLSDEAAPSLPAVPLEHDGVV